MSTAPRYEFGPFVVDSASYRLLKEGSPVALSPKALDLLLLFVGRPAKLVTKDDILKALWPDVAVTDNALTQVVSELRQALGDNPAAPVYVETVPRRGYRFVAPVGTAAVENDLGGLFTKNVKRPPRSFSIAVPDFVNASGEAEIAWLAAGIAETVTNDLRAIRDLRVIDRALVTEAAKRAPAEMAKAAGVDLVVIGSYQRAGTHLRITASAVDLQTHQARASAKADGPLTDVFQLQDAIVTQLSAGLQLTVTPAAAARIHARETWNFDAYRALTEGRLKLETLDADEIPRAIADFERALALDPAYALAHVGLAHARFWRFQASRAKNRPDVEELTASIAHARRAIEIDDDLAEAHSALAFFLASAERPVEAVTAGRRALVLEPGNWRHQFRLGIAAWGTERLDCLDAVTVQFPQMAYAYFGIAMVHVARQEIPAAVAALDRGLSFQRPGTVALERFPGKGLHWLRGLIKLAAGDATTARAEFDRELALPGRAIYSDEFAMDAYDGHGFALLETDDAAAAADMFGRALERFPDHARSLIGQAQALKRQRQRRKADALLDRAKSVIDELRRYHRHADAALATAFLHVLDGQCDEAIAVLDQWLARAPAGFAGWTIPIEPFLKPLRTQPGFAAVLKRLSDRAR